MLRKRGGLIDLYIFICDLAALTAAWFLSQALYVWLFAKESASSREALLIMLLGYLLTALFFNTNRGFLKRRDAEEFLSLLKLTVVYLLIVGALVFVIHLQDEVSRFVTAATLALFFLFSYPIRIILKKLLRKRSQETGTRMLLVTGAHPSREEIRKLSSDLLSTKKIEGLLIPDGEGLTEGDAEASGSERPETDGDPAVLACGSCVFSYVRREVVDEVLLNAGSSERHLVVNRAVVADDGRLADHYSVAVVDEKSAAYFRTGVDLDSRPPARALRDPARDKGPPERKQPKRHKRGKIDRGASNRGARAVEFRPERGGAVRGDR